jgi:proline racemase
MLHVLKTIDAHVEGEPLRLVTEGLPRPSGATMAQKTSWMKRRADHLRRALVLEPRGHRDMCAAFLTEPVSVGADAGLIFMQNDGYAPISGHAIIAVATIVLERGLFFAAAPADVRPTPLAPSLRPIADPTSGDERLERRLVFDTVAGTVHVRGRVEGRGDRQRVASVAFANVPSFVLSGGHAVRVGSRTLRVDIAFGGVFYAIADTEATGIPLTGERLPELRRLGVEIRESINSAGGITHPVDANLSDVAGVIFTGPAQNPEAHLRNITIFGDGAADRSPCATGTTAVMSVLDAMGLLQDDQPFVHESVLGTLHRGRVVRRTEVGTLAALVAEVEGVAWITGEHAFHVDENDPFNEGFTI